MFPSGFPIPYSDTVPPLSTLERYAASLPLSFRVYRLPLTRASSVTDFLLLHDFRA